MTLTQTTSELDQLLEHRRLLEEAHGYRWACIQLRQRGQAELTMLEMPDCDIRKEIVGKEHLEVALRSLCRLLQEHDRREQINQRRRQVVARGGKLRKHARLLKIFKASPMQLARLSCALEQAERQLNGQSTRRTKQRRRSRANPQLARSRQMRHG